eukprot:TRINITY_DN11165_c0_g1_i3.p1 TRINITY_DN11165_c0_g1~~TRINITY_DN11165_c0_g1_i3.p1  ORF type:complete len:264 (-),score=17.87 TRINITY_DN11165_c0_g1_i3:40-831(-)
MLSFLPSHVLHRVLLGLPHGDVCYNLALVCHKLRDITLADSLWMALCEDKLERHQDCDLSKKSPYLSYKEYYHDILYGWLGHVSPGFNVHNNGLSVSFTTYMPGGNQYATGTVPLTRRDNYFEVRIDTFSPDRTWYPHPHTADPVYVNSLSIGLSPLEDITRGGGGQRRNGPYYYYGNGGDIVSHEGKDYYIHPSHFRQGDTIGVRLDYPSNRVVFYINGTQQATLKYTCTSGTGDDHLPMVPTVWMGDVGTKVTMIRKPSML